MPSLPAESRPTASWATFHCVASTRPFEGVEVILPWSGGANWGLGMVVGRVLARVKALVCDWVLGWGARGVWV